MLVWRPEAAPLLTVFYDLSRFRSVRVLETQAQEVLLRVAMHTVAARLEVSRDCLLLGEAVTVLTCIREVSGFSLGRNINCLEVLRGLFSGPADTAVVSWIISLNSAVGIATGYGLGDAGVGVRVPKRLRMFFTTSRPILGPNQPHFQRVPGCEAEHTPN
jgi:hypothetical protein